MQIMEINQFHYTIRDYPGYLSGTEVQRLLQTTFGFEFPVEDWEIRIDSVTIGTERMSHAFISKRIWEWT